MDMQLVRWLYSENYILHLKKLSFEVNSPCLSLKNKWVLHMLELLVGCHEPAGE